MALQLVSAVASDALRIVQIERDAYSKNPYNDLLFPGPFPSDILEKRASQLAADLESNPTTTKWWKVVDPTLEGDEQLISFAQWNIYETAPPIAPPQGGLGPGTNAAACEELFGGLAKQRVRLIGQNPHVYLRYLHTDPKHWGRGAGRMLVQVGLAEASRLNLPAYLQSSSAAHNLYLNCGFIDVEELSVDMTKYGMDDLSKFGGDGIHRTWAMRRDASD